MKKINGVIFQSFEWYLDCKQQFWNNLKENAVNLKKIGFTAIWLPPAYKAIGGKDDVGYGVYDLYDLGEFDQKGSIKTKYGSKDEYIDCVKTLNELNIETYADIVLNHKMGADAIQTIPATKVDWGNHNLEISGQETIKVATKFTFPGRNHKYSDFEWNWTHFNGIDYNNQTNEHAIFKFKNKNWDQTVDEEFGNFDYLMGADLDFENEAVREECHNWLKWYIDETKVTGLRLDAVKHIDANFYRDLIKRINKEFNKTFFSVGEYWNANVETLHKYLTETEGIISLFDVPLHYNFEKASKDENFDLTKIFENTLAKDNPSLAVTFVDNHDTQPGQALQSFVQEWFKLPAYSLILLRDEGYPCVFYGDLFGIEHDDIKPVTNLNLLLELRKERSYGKQNDYFDNPNCIGWTREGDPNHKDSGLAVLISNADNSEKMMYIGEKFKGKIFTDLLKNCCEEVKIDENGYGIFKVKGRSISIWGENHTN